MIILLEMLLRSIEISVAQVAQVKTRVWFARPRSSAFDSRENGISVFFPTNHIYMGACTNLRESYLPSKSLSKHISSGSLGARVAQRTSNTTFASSNETLLTHLHPAVPIIRKIPRKSVLRSNILRVATVTPAATQN